jgi:PTS system nitrogen regulatory IIA component
MEGEEPFAAIAFPLRPLDWHTPDGSKVHTIFLIVSKSAKQHLGVLSKINFLCQEEKFYSLIKSQAPKEEIIDAIRRAEAEWAG